MLLDPHEGRGVPQELPHWPCAQAVDDALTARGLAPGSVRAGYHGLERGLTTYIRLGWEERRGWYSRPSDAGRRSGAGGRRGEGIGLLSAGAGCGVPGRVAWRAGGTCRGRRLPPQLPRSLPAATGGHRMRAGTGPGVQLTSIPAPTRSSRRSQRCGLRRGAAPPAGGVQCAGWCVGVRRAHMGAGKVPPVAGCV